MAISAIMTRKVVTTTADANLASLRQIFTEAHFQHVPVIDGTNRVLGIVSVKDFYKSFSAVADAATSQTTDLFLQARKVRTIMTSPVIAVRPEATVLQAASLLLQHNISCLLVTDSQQILLGIVSWKDILRLIVQRQQQKRQRQEEEE